MRSDSARQFDDVRALNAGDDPHRSAAGRARLDIDAEHPLQALRLSHLPARSGERNMHRACRWPPITQCRPRQPLCFTDP